MGSNRDCRAGLDQHGHHPAVSNVSLNQVASLIEFLLKVSGLTLPGNAVLFIPQLKPGVVRRLHDALGPEEVRIKHVLQVES